MTPILVKFVGAFLLAGVTDWLWAKYIQFTADGLRLKAAFFSSMIALWGGILSIGYIQDNRLLIPMILGYFVGTYLSVKPK